MNLIFIGRMGAVEERRQELSKNRTYKISLNSYYNSTLCIRTSVPNKWCYDKSVDNIYTIASGSRFLCACRLLNIRQFAGNASDMIDLLQICSFPPSNRSIYGSSWLWLRNSTDGILEWRIQEQRKVAVRQTYGIDLEQVADMTFHAEMSP